MPIKKITVLNSDGSIWWLDDTKDLNKLEKSFPRDTKWKRTGTLRELQNKYFGMLKELNTNANTGYTDSALHEAIKPLLFNKFTDLTHLFKTEQHSYSTKDLTIEGWQQLIQELKVTANDVFGYIFAD